MRTPPPIEGTPNTTTTGAIRSLLVQAFSMLSSIQARDVAEQAALADTQRCINEAVSSLKKFNNLRSIRSQPTVCPECSGTLRLFDDVLLCEGCGEEYEVLQDVAT